MCVTYKTQLYSTKYIYIIKYVPTNLNIFCSDFLTRLCIFVVKLGFLVTWYVLNTKMTKKQKRINEYNNITVLQINKNYQQA